MTIERNVKGLLGTKLGMTQLWDENNRIVPVTVIAAGTNVVTQVRTPEKDGYNAIQVGFGEIDGRKVNKPRAGHFQTRRHHAAPAPGRDPHHHRRRVRRGPGAPGRHLRRRRRDRRDRHQQGQGLRRRHEAPRLPRCLVLARCPPQPPQAGLHRRLRDPGSRLQGRPDGRPDGLGHRHHPEPHGARRGRRQGPDPREGRHPGPQGWPRRAPLGRQEDTSRRPEHGYQVRAPRARPARSTCPPRSSTWRSTSR